MNSIVNVYNKLIAFVVTLVAAIGAYIGLVAVHSAEVIVVSVPLAFIIVGAVYIVKQGNVEKKRIMSAKAIGKVYATPLEDYTKLFTLVITFAGALISFFVKDPTQAGTLQQFLVQIIQPVGIIILGLILGGVQSSISNTAVVTPPAPVPIPTPIPNPVPIPPSPTPIVAPVVPISLVKDRVATAITLVSTDAGMWDYLMQNLGDKINAAMQHMLSVNPNMATIDAVKAVVAQYLGVSLTVQQCSDVQSILGLPQVLFAYHDQSILQSFKDAALSGHLSAGMVQMFRNTAVRYASVNIVNEATMRVQNDDLPIEQRWLALQEFGLSADVAHQAIFSGGMVTINWMGSWRAFDPWALSGVSPW
jgi:hypothetical protein